MRSHFLRGLIPRRGGDAGPAALFAVLVAVLVAGALRAHAQPAPPPPTAADVSVTLVAPERLVAGSTAMVVAEVSVPAGGDAPLLLTPTTEGTAVEVVRGRLLRADAERTANGTLRFRIPILAKSPGNSVLRVRVVTYACSRRCRAEEADAFIVLRVDRP